MPHSRLSTTLILAVVSITSVLTLAAGFGGRDLTYAGNRLSEPEYHYYLTDHLGNNRMDVTDDGAVWQAMDYYPFGMPMASSYLPGKQRWLFGGNRRCKITLLHVSAKAL